ncbi:MDR family MFS transporter [Streptomyces sp. NPDC052043]|uniref:MDR family MFS transporter n=1 Tax=Streptomyces sp. NPDC052043 TaxID=3365684 RepID=UPI0037D650B1
MSTSAAPSPNSGLRRVLPGLMLALLLSMLDAMIVATALPTIAGDLGGFSRLSWVITAYILTSTVSTPLWGRMSDFFSRKQLLLASIVIFTIGSVLCGVAQSMGALIAFRALQGIGAGGLMVGVMAVIGVMAPPRERGKYQSYIAALSAVATVGGPLLGGALTDHASWRWAFYLNLPIAAVAVWFVAARLNLPHNRGAGRIDYLGAALLSVASAAVVLFTTWGGNQYAWGSPTILGLIALAVVVIIATVVVERRAAQPILPPHLFRSRNFVASLVLGFLVGIALYGTITYLPVYQQSVQHLSATSSGLLLLPVLGGMLVASMYSGRLMSESSRHRVILLAGGVLLSVGSFLLSMLDVDTSRVVASVYMVVFGLGLGLLFQNVMVITQNSVELKDMGVASGTLTFFRSIGGSFGTALFAAVFTSRLSDSLDSKLSAAELEAVHNNGGRAGSSAIESLSQSARTAYVDAVASGTQSMFRWALPFFVVAVLVALFLQDKSKQAQAAQAPAPAKAQEAGSAS